MSAPCPQRAALGGPRSEAAAAPRSSAPRPQAAQGPGLGEPATAAAAPGRSAPAAALGGSLAEPAAQEPPASYPCLLSRAKPLGGPSDEEGQAPPAPARAGLSKGGTLRTAAGGDYLLERHLGSGAFGDVWLCSHDGEPRAVKVVPMTGASGVAREVELSRRGARLGGVGYGHVPKFYEAAEGSLVGGSLDPFLMIVMEYIEGVTLGKAIAGQKLEEEIVKVIAVDLLRTLARLHEEDFVHRDVKPDNIILNKDGFAYLCDFGVSRFLRGRPEDDEGAGEVVGTLLYMAPEVQLGGSDCKVDVWSAGMTLYELLHGSNPVLDELGEIAHPAMYLQHLALMPAPSVRRLKVSSVMERMLRDCLRRDPTQRASAKDLLVRRGMRVGQAERSYTAQWCRAAMRGE